MPKEINPDTDLLDMRGKVALVTGGSTGIGLVTIQFLARRGAKVYMGARSAQKAKAAIAKIEAEGLGSMGGSVEYLELDISHPKLAKQAAERFLAKEQRLDVLINNAAMLINPYKLQQDGLSDIMVTNHLGPFVLTDTLLPLMKQTSELPDGDVRIINLTSDAHSFPKNITSMKGKEAFNKKFGDGIKSQFVHYGYSKLASILHIKELQRRLSASHPRITCMTVHPGGVQTQASFDYFGSFRFGLGYILVLLVKLFFITEYQGAQTSAFAGAGKKVPTDERYRGAYLIPYGQIGKSSDAGANDRLAQEWWETTEEILKEIM